MSSQQSLIDVISNNVANINTYGFKRVQADISDLIYEQVRPATQEYSGLSIGTGSSVASATPVFTQGALTETGLQTDLAIVGEGFFILRAPNEDVYTRAGHFRVDPDGYLVSPEGWRLDDLDPVPREYTGISVSRDGRVFALMPDGSYDDLGQIKLARFRSPTGLIPIGNGVYRESEASGPARKVDPGEHGAGVITQGFLERANVDLAQEMVSVIAAQRAYDVCAKIVQVGDEMLQAASNMKR